MNLKKTFKIMSYAVATAGFLTLIFTGKLSALEIGVIVSSIAASWFFGRRLVMIPRADTVATAAILAIFVLSVVGFFFFDRPFVATTTGFLISVQAVRLLFLTEMRHYLQVYLISLFSVVAATILTFSPTFLLFFVLYLVLATATMIVFTMVADAERIRGSVGNIELKRSVLALLTLGSVTFTAVSTALFFIFFPRLSAGFFPSSIAPPIRVPGFSNNVELGEVGDLKITSETIMRIVIDKADVARLGKDVYWRGTSFDTFDGKYWEKSNKKSFAARRMGNRFILDDKTSSRFIHQEYFLEPADSRVLFSLGHPAVLSGPFQDIFTDPYGTVKMGGSANDKIRYTVDSVLTTDVDTRSPESAVRLSPGERAVYLSLPKVLDPRIRPLVSGIVGAEPSPTIKARLVRDWLLSNMSYDLNPKGIGDDPLADFLFREKRGYCEHFATAMVIMLRVAGVPSRIVTGFLTGEYNEMGSFFTVRSSDAHAWVEVYTDDAGWTVYEPTPPAGLSAPFARSSIRELFDNLVMKWNIYVVNYEMGDQLKLIQGIHGMPTKGRDTFSGTQSNVKRFLAGLKEKKWAVAIPIFVGVAVLFSVLFWHTIRSLVSDRGQQKKRGGGVIRTYLSAVRFLAKRGVRKEPSMTPREFSERVAVSFPAVSGDIDALTDIYYRQRFGGREDSAEENNAAKRHVVRIRELIR